MHNSMTAMIVVCDSVMVSLNKYVAQFCDTMMSAYSHGHTALFELLFVLVKGIGRYTDNTHSVFV